MRDDWGGVKEKGTGIEAMTYSSTATSSHLGAMSAIEVRVPQTLGRLGVRIGMVLQISSRARRSRALIGGGTLGEMGAGQGPGEQSRSRLHVRRGRPSSYAVCRMPWTEQFSYRRGHFLCDGGCDESSVGRGDLKLANLTEHAPLQRGTTGFHSSSDLPKTRSDLLTLTSPMCVRAPAEPVHQMAITPRSKSLSSEPSLPDATLASCYDPTSACYHCH